MGWQYEQIETDHVKPIFDAENAIEVKVTAGTCVRARGHKDDPAKCVLAQALRVGYGSRLVGVQVLDSKMYLELKTEVLRFQVPTQTRRAINGFDLDEHFPPGTYRFDPVPLSQTREAQYEARARTKGMQQALSGELGRHAQKQARRAVRAKPGKPGWHRVPRGERAL